LSNDVYTTTKSCEWRIGLYEAEYRSYQQNREKKPNIQITNKFSSIFMTYFIQTFSPKSFDRRSGHPQDDDLTQAHKNTNVVNRITITY